MNRLYAIETMPSLTGSRADHRFAVRPSRIASAALALARAVGVSGLAEPAPHRRRQHRGYRPRSVRASGLEPRDRRRQPAPDRSRARARDERRARQRRPDRRVHGAGRSVARRSAGVNPRVDRRDEQRTGRRAADSRRQPGLHDALGSGVLRGPGEGAAARASELSTRTKRRSAVTGRFPRRTSSNRGAMCAPTMAPCPSSSR